MIFQIMPLSYDERTTCSSFELTLTSDCPTTTHELNIDALFEAYPDMHRHRCDSGHHRSFEVEARQTETAHLLEHLAVELLVQSGIPRDSACGETGIPKDGRRTYRLNFYGAPSLAYMDALLHEAALLFEKLILR